MKNIYFFGDAHLGIGVGNTSLREDRLVELLNNVEKDAEEIFILGDLFEFWFEYKHLNPKGHVLLLSKLKQMVKRGIKVNYIVGNHDFALGSFLPEEIGVTLYWEPLNTTLHGKKFYIAHGDGLYKYDIGYRILKPILRSKINQALYRLIPADIAMGIAKTCSSISRNASSKSKMGKIKDTYRKIASDLIDKGYDSVVIGHTHIADELHYKNGTYVNTGAWRKKNGFPYGVLSNGKLSLKLFE